MDDRAMGQPAHNPNAETFAHTAEGRPSGLLSEFWSFARHHKRWWITPIIVILLLVAALVFLGGTGAGPLIYPLF